MTRFTRNASRIGLVLLLATSVVGCESFLDVNEDPNNPENVRMDLTLPGMLMGFGHQILGPIDSRYSNLHGPVGNGPQWMNQYSDNRDNHTYSQFQWFELLPDDSDAYWGASYADVMQEAKNIMTRSEESEQWHYYGIAELIFAWNAALLTDAHGAIPLSEAFDIENRTPAYDTQQQVYQAVFGMVDDAIAKMQQGGPQPPATNDVVYGGDMTKWVKLANSEKARLHMRLVYAPGESATEQRPAALDALGAGMQSPADAPTVGALGGTGPSSPGTFTTGRTKDLRVGGTGPATFSSGTPSRPTTTRDSRFSRIPPSGVPRGAQLPAGGGLCNRHLRHLQGEPDGQRRRARLGHLEKSVILSRPTTRTSCGSPTRTPSSWRQRPA